MFESPLQMCACSNAPWVWYCVNPTADSAPHCVAHLQHICSKKLQEHMPKRIHVDWRALVELLHVFAKLALARIWHLLKSAFVYVSLPLYIEFLREKKTRSLLFRASSLHFSPKAIFTTPSIFSSNATSYLLLVWLYKCISERQQHKWRFQKTAIGKYWKILISHFHLPISVLPVPHTETKYSTNIWRRKTFLSSFTTRQSSSNVPPHPPNWELRGKSPTAGPVPTHSLPPTGGQVRWPPPGPPANVHSLPLFTTTPPTPAHPHTRRHVSYISSSNF